MERNIHLNGGEITILKTLGLGGTQMAGKLLIDRMGEVEAAEFLDSLGGLLSFGYVITNKVNVRSMEDVERAFFRVNPADAKDLKEAMFPNRARQQDRARRRRRG
jgi:hypothetical protein